MFRRNAVNAVVLLVLVTGGGLGAESSNASSAAVPRNKTAPAIQGQAQEGSILKAEHGRWRGDSTLTFQYQWRRCAGDGSGCVDIPKATDLIYAIRSDDVGHSLVVFVTAHTRDGAASAQSKPTAAVVASGAQAPHATGLPVINHPSARVFQASPGTWTGAAPITYSYRWRRCTASGGACTDTPTRTSTYNLSSSDAGHALRVVVTAKNAGGSANALSDPSPSVSGPAKPVNTAPPTIFGTAAQGKTLTGARGTWGNNPATFEYRWLRCGKQGDQCGTIGGARGTSYLLTASDVGHTVRFAVRAAGPAGSTTALSAPTAVVAAAQQPLPHSPQNTAAPKISGTARQGQTLRADRGDWTNNPSDYDFSWLRCDAGGANCGDISGAHGTSYTPTSGDVGHTLRFKVTAKNKGGSSVAVSAPTAAVVATSKQPQPANGSRPTISGTPQEGNTLTGNRGAWQNNPTDFDYSWLRCNQNGDGCDGINAHGTTYRLTGADVGHTLRFRATAKNAAGSTTATSVPTAVIRTSARPSISSPPTVSGVPQEGKTLSGNRGNWARVDDFDYAWLRCDRNGGSCAAISGARSTSYTPVSADVGNTLRFQVTAKNSAGTRTATSVPTAAIRKAAAPAPPPPSNGCPAGNPKQVSAMSLPTKLIIDRFEASPRVLTRRTTTFQLRVHVTSTCGGDVQGALVYGTGTPFNQFTIEEQPTDSTGWASLTFQRLSNFPVNNKQGILAMFLRARKSGENVLGGITGYRLVSIRVNVQR
jgi:hypothetical protein